MILFLFCGKVFYGTNKRKTDFTQIMAYLAVKRCVAAFFRGILETFTVMAKHNKKPPQLLPNFLCIRRKASLGSF